MNQTEQSYICLCIYLYLCVFSMRRIESDVIQSIEKIITSSHSKTKPKRETIPLRNATPEMHAEWKEMHTGRQRKSKLSKSYTQIKHLQSQRTKMYEEMAEVRDFKMTNPRSEYLVYKSPRKPIYERVDIILRNREAKMAKIRQEVSHTNRLKQEKEKEICRGSIHYNKTLPTNQLERKGKEMFEQGESRQQRMNEMRLAYMKQEAKLQRDKPLISQTSNKIYGRLVEKKKLDTHLLNRFAQYDIKHTEEREEVDKEVALQYYPFKPTITLSDNSTAFLQQRIGNHTPSHAHCSSCRWL